MKKEKKEKKAKVPKIINPCLNAIIDTTEVATDHYGVYLPFKPSNTQLKRYAQHFSHKCVMDYRKKPPTVTFDDDAVTKMVGRYPNDPLYPLLAEYRELERCRGTYVEGIKPGEDGRYREAFKHNPKTLRLAMRVLQLLPRENKDEPDSFYNQVRNLFVAEPGKVLLARDFSGIEAVMVMYLANDPVGYRLAAQVQGMHDFVATSAIGQPADMKWSDSDLMAFFKEFKKENRVWRLKSGQELTYDTIRYACKRAVFLSFYGGGAGRLLQQEPKTFGTKAIAQFYQDLILKETFPSIEHWQWKTCEEAERKGFVTAPSGFRMYYPDGVFTYNHTKEVEKCDEPRCCLPNGKGQNWHKKMGEIAKECIAAKPQHMGMMFSALAMQECAKDTLLSSVLRLSIHDELFCEVPIDNIAEVDVKLQEIMERPMMCMPLDASWNAGSHVSVRTESKQGLRWGMMK